MNNFAIIFLFLIFFPVGRSVFRDFLKCEYSEENILFWLACEDLKEANTPETVEEKARYIYEEFISILSPREVRALSHVCLIIIMFYKLCF